MPGEQLSKEKRNWSFLVYIAGDNDLSKYAMTDVEELCRVGVSKEVHAALEYDTMGSAEHKGSFRYEITEKRGPRGYRTLIKRLSERDSGSPGVLRDFLAWGLEHYPAEKTVAVIWGHGSSFRSKRRAVASDAYGSALDIPEIDWVLKELEIGEQGGRDKLAILGFDACLMSMLEIAYELRRRAQVLVGSQQKEPGDGWPYDKVLGAINTISGDLAADAPQRLGQEIVRCYLESYKRTGESYVTQSAIRLGKIESTARAVHDLGAGLLDLINDGPKVRSRLSEVRLKTLAFDLSDHVDLFDLARNLVKADIAKDKAEVVLRCAEESVCEGKTWSDDWPEPHPGGLSIWFPDIPQLHTNHRPAYSRLQFPQARSDENPGWLQFVDAYLGRGR